MLGVYLYKFSNCFRTISPSKVSLTFACWNCMHYKTLLYYAFSYKTLLYRAFSYNLQSWLYDGAAVVWRDNQSTLINSNEVFLKQAYGETVFVNALGVLLEKDHLLRGPSSNICLGLVIDNRQKPNPGLFWRSVTGQRRKGNSMIEAIWLHTVKPTKVWLLLNATHSSSIYIINCWLPLLHHLLPAFCIRYSCIMPLLKVHRSR